MRACSASLVIATMARDERYAAGVLAVLTTVLDPAAATRIARAAASIATEALAQAERGQDQDHAA